MSISFYISGELNGSSYVRIPLRRFALVNIENGDKFCLIWSILASLLPCENGNCNRVSNCKQNFSDLKISGFGFSNGFECSDLHKFEKLSILSINIFELYNYEEQNKWKNKLIHCEYSKIESDKVIDLLSYKNHCNLNKKLKVCLGKQDCRYICKRCLKSYTSANMIIRHKQQCIRKEKTSINTSPESHLRWKNHFYKNPFNFRVYANFEADNEKEDSKAVCNKTTNIYKQIPVCNGYEIGSELENVLKSGCYKSPLGYKNVDWFVDENIKLEKKDDFYFRNTSKDIIMTQEHEEDFEIIIFCRFCEKQIIDSKVGVHCHLIGKYRGPAHSKCNIIVKQSQSIFIKGILHNFSNYDSHLFFKKLVDKKKNKVEFKIIPKTNEEYISNRYGCVRCFDSYQFLSSSLDKLVETLVDNSHKSLEISKKKKLQVIKIY